MASIQKTYLVDTHTDAVNNVRHSAKAEMNIDAFQVINALESLGYTAIDYSEQGYERSAADRRGNGYYTVNFRSNMSDSVGIVLIDAKDGQSSMKVFAGVWIGDRVFPLVLIEEIKHRRHESHKVNTLEYRLAANVSESVTTVRNSMKALQEKKLTTEAANRFSQESASVRMAHPNYRRLPHNMLFSVAQGTSAFNMLLLCLASYADVRWTRHHITLTQGIYSLFTK